MPKSDRCFASMTVCLIITGGLVAPVGVLFSPPAIAQTTNAQTADAQKKAEVDRLRNQAIDQLEISQYEAALQTFQQSLSLSREIKDRQREAKALGGLGMTHNFLGNYAKAIAYLNQSLTIGREIKDRQWQGIVLSGLGIVYGSLGNETKAIESFEQCLAIARELKDRQKEADALGYLGTAYFALRNYVKEIEYQEQRLAITREIKDRRGEGQALGSLGDAYQSLGKYAKAIEYLEQRLAITREIKDRSGEGSALSGLANAYKSLKNIAKAIEYQEQRLAIARAIKDRKVEGLALFDLGFAYFNLENFDKAIEYTQQSLAITREIKDRVLEGTTLHFLGSIRFLAFQGGMLLPGGVRYKVGSLPQAEQDLFAAIAVFESLRADLTDTDKVSIADSIFQRNPYLTLQEILIAQKKVESALEVAERGRARAFVELLAKRGQTTATTTVEVAERGRAKAFTELLAQRTPPVSISFAAIQQVAKAEQATLVQYSIIKQGLDDDKALFIWVVQPTGKVDFRQVDLRDLRDRQQQALSLDTLVKRSRECLVNSSLNCRSLLPQTAQPKVSEAATLQRPKYPALQRLHQLLIQPIADLLPQDANAPVIFMPQGALFLVPFAALQDAQGNDLIDQHTMATAPAIQVLQLTHNQRDRVTQRGLKENLVVGNPTMPQSVAADGTISDPPPALLGAEREATAIAPLLNTQPLIGAQATEVEVTRRMVQSRIIHLATHGIFDNQKGLQSAIALAPTAGGGDPRTNGWLTAAEILNLNLTAELVVLSACDTGQGRISGDGVIGLSRSLISAGVPSVLVSLWQVPDAPTAALMTQFYKNLQQSPNKAKALRQSMLATKKAHPHPSNWAAFVLIGEME